MKQFIVLITLIILNSILVSAQEVVVSANVDKDTVSLNETFNFQLNINLPRGYTLSEFNLEDSITTKQFEIKTEGKLDTIVNADKLLVSKSFVLHVFKEGKNTLPNIPIKYQTSEGEVDTAYYTPPSIFFKLPQTQENKLAPIKNIEEIKTPIPWELISIVAGTTLIIAGLIAWLIIARRKTDEVIVEQAPEVITPPHEVALTDLQALKAAALWQKGEVKDYHSQLTHIVRRYLEQQFNIAALESTSPEIMQEIAKISVLSPHKQSISQLLNIADLVKFAKATPEADLHEQLLKQAETLVLQTTKTTEE